MALAASRVVLTRRGCLVAFGVAAADPGQTGTLRIVTCTIEADSPSYPHSLDCYLWLGADIIE